MDQRNPTPFIRDGGTIRIFVDGREHDNHSFASFTFASPGALRIGFSPIHTEGNEYFRGLLYGVHLSHGVVYTEPFLPVQMTDTADTILMWDFSEGEGTEVSSMSTDVVGTIDGASWVEECPFGL